jgi:hypothetical protein
MVQRTSLVRAAPLPSFRNLKPLRFRGGGALADVHDSGVLFAAGTPALATAVLFLLFALFSGGHKAAGAPSRHGAEGSGLLRTMVYGVCALLVVAALALRGDGASAPLSAISLLAGAAVAAALPAALATDTGDLSRRASLRSSAVTAALIVLLLALVAPMLIAMMQPAGAAAAKVAVVSAALKAASAAAPKSLSRGNGRAAAAAAAAAAARKAAAVLASSGDVSRSDALVCTLQLAARVLSSAGVGALLSQLLPSAAPSAAPSAMEDATAPSTPPP